MSRYFALLIFILSVSASIYGYLHQDLNSVPIWQPSIYNSTLAALGLFNIAYFFIFYKSKSRSLTNAIIFSIFTLLFIAVREYFSLLLIIVSSITLGGVFVKKEEIEELPFRLICSFLVGLGLQIPVVYILSHYKLNYNYTHALIWLLPIFIRKNDFYNLFIELKSYVGKSKESTKAEVVLSAFCSFISFFTLLYAILPEAFHDAVSVYLYILEYIKSRGLWHFDPETAIYANVSFGSVWLESSAYILGGVLSPKLLSWSCVVSSCLLVYYTLKNSKINETFSLLALILLSSISVVFLISVSLFYDSFVMAFVTAAICLMLSHPNLLAIAILAGAAFATKSTALFPIFSLFLVYLFDSILVKTTKFKDLLKPIFFFIIVGTPAYLFCYFKTGNPFFPFLNNVFKSSLIPPTGIDSPLIGKMNWKFLYNMTFKTSEYLESYKGGFGFTFLILLPATFCLSILTFKKRESYILICLMIGAIIQSKIDPNIRYLTQFMPALVILSFIQFKEFLDNSYVKKFGILTCILVVGFNLKHLASSASMFMGIEPLTYFDQKKLNSFVESFASQQVIAKKVPTIFNGRPKILTLNAGGLGAVDADVLIYNWYNHKTTAELVDATTKTMFDSILKKYGVTHIIERVDSKYNNYDNFHYYLITNTKVLIRDASNIVYQLSDDIIYGREYSTNSDFNDGLVQWELSQVKPYNKLFKGADIQPSGYAAQVYDVLEGKSIKIHIKYLCDLNPQALSVQYQFINEKGLLESASRVDTACNMQMGTKEFDREIKVLDGSKKLRIAVSGLTSGIKVDQVKVMGW